MIHKTIVITIGLALVLITVMSAVPMSQKTYAAGSPGVGTVGGSGSGNPNSGGNFFLNFGGDSSSGAGGGTQASVRAFGGGGTQGAGGAGAGPVSPGLFCTPLNCGGGSGNFNVGGDSVGKGGAP